MWCVGSNLAWGWLCLLTKGVDHAMLFIQNKYSLMLIYRKIQLISLGYTSERK